MPGLWATLKPKVVALWLRRPLNAPHVVCWHGNIAPNLRASTVPLVEFTLRPYPDHGTLPQHLLPDAFGPPTTRYFPATMLGQYRLGSVIKGRESDDTLPENLTPRDFHVDFSPSGWTLELASDALAPYAPLPIPWLDGLSFDSPLIVLRLDEDGTLLVPCFEFFSRCYGHSKELQRVLLTYPWSEVERRLFRTLEPPPPGYEGTWYVRFGPDMTKSDAVFLAHIQYDGYTRSAVKRSYTKREAASVRSDPQVPIDVGPWFQECAKLRVRGYQLDGSAFLALRVDGSSEPTQGPPVYFERTERTSRLDDSEEEPGSGDDQPGLWRRFFHPPRDLPTHAGRDPDPAAGTGRPADPEFVILGERRAVFSTPRKRESDQRRSGSGRVSEPAEYSTSEPGSTGEGIGQLQFVSVRALESEGMLLDMWNALQFLRERHPDEIESVEWFTFAEGFRSDSPPHLIQFPTPRTRGDDGAVYSTQEKWCLMDPDVPVQDTRARGVLVMRLRVKDAVLCFVEIERRTLGDEDKERFSGLVFPLVESDDLDKMLPPFLGQLPAVRGVFANVRTSRPEGAKSFRHSPAPGQRVACEAAVLNAFRKMGLTFVR